MFIELGYTDNQDKQIKHLYSFPREKEHLYKQLALVELDKSKRCIYLKAIHTDNQYHGRDNFVSKKDRRKLKQSKIQQAFF